MAEKKKLNTSEIEDKQDKCDQLSNWKQDSLEINQAKSYLVHKYYSTRRQNHLVLQTKFTRHLLASSTADGLQPSSSAKGDQGHCRHPPATYRSDTS